MTVQPRRDLAPLAAVAVALGLGCDSGPTAPRGTATPSNCLARAVFGPPAQSEYILPYPVGAAYRVLQSYCNANGSHANQLAYDFLTPEGSPVVAAREGLVVAVVDQWPDSDWNGTHFNHVLVRHDDNSVAFYAHLQMQRIEVRLGDRVDVGQPIGNSGHSGTPVADLHFGVYRSWPPVEGDDLAISFRNAQGSLDARGGLQEGVTYTALPY